MDDIVQEFLIESHENLDQLDRDLVALENEPGSTPLLSSIFRTVHTIKGTSGFLGLAALESVSHSGESLLSELRDGKRAMDRPTTDVLLHLVDVIRAMLDSIEAGVGDSAVDATDVLHSIRAILETPVCNQSGAQKPVSANPAAVPHEATTVSAPPVVSQPETATAAQDKADPIGQVNSADQVNSAGQADSADQADPNDQVDSAGQADSAGQDPTHGAAQKAEQPEGRAPEKSTAPDSPRSLPAPAPHPESTGPRVSAADSSVRVDVGLLDALMRQVGELVLVRNQIERLIEKADSVDLQRSAQNLNLISSELQEGVMKTRMQPIDHVWSKMPRVVRDLATSLGRQINLVMEGRETELDRSLLEAVKDPLTHLVRNAVDHGIETPEVRVNSGKSPTGTVALRAYHAGGQVVIEISDDGKGIDPDAVRATAIRRNILTEAQASKLSATDAFNLLFQPGFSTAEKVTNVSGRGVGMDVVRSKIEAIGGSVDVDSRLGKGTTWRLRIPLTLAIMPALTVGCGDEVFAIAQINLLELVAIEDRDNDTNIEYVGNAPVYRLRGALLPMVSLADVLGIKGSGGEGVIAVMQVDEQRFGLIVDRVINTEEIVVKALSGRIKQLGLYSGATVLGDGAVALILDVQAVSRRALAGDSSDRIRAQAAAYAPEAAEKESEQLLVVAASDGRRVGMPLSSVIRLERMSEDRIERVGTNEVVQYRGELLPLVRLDSVLSSFGGGDCADMVVIVVRGQSGQQVAVVVSEIIDIVECDPNTHSKMGGAGLLGSTVAGEKVTELLDLAGLIDSVVPASRNDYQMAEV